jgi:hypothetical protein
MGESFRFGLILGRARQIEAQLSIGGLAASSLAYVIGMDPVCDKAGKAASLLCRKKVRRQVRPPAAFCAAKAILLRVYRMSQ